MTRPLAAALATLPALAFAAAAQTTWTALGPAPIAGAENTGRVAAIACSRTDPDRYWVGGADGGLWLTRDGGATWRALGDGLPTTAIGALALGRDERVLYVGTGEANYANHSRYGLGILRTADGGQTFERLGVAEFAGRTFARLRVDPRDDDVVFAAVCPAGGFPARSAARGHPGAGGPLGVFKTGDGGRTWTHLRTGLPARDATDVALDPSNPDVVYAAIGDIFGHADNGVYRSDDGGQSWRKLGGGLPASPGRLTIALAPSRPQRLFVQAVQPASADGGNADTLGVYRSDDGGATFANQSAVGSYQSTYGWYLCTSAVHPTNPDLVFVGGLSCRRSANGGASWSTVTPPHVDLHALEFDAAGRLVCGNDGGVHRRDDARGTWQARNDGLGLIQIYAGMSTHPTRADEVWIGAQDNGTLGRRGSTWSSALGGDGGCTAVDPTGTRVFAEYQGTGNLFRSINGGSFSRSSAGINGRNCFLPPFLIHDSDGMAMVYGTERVFRSGDGGTTWSPISPDLTGGGGAALRGLGWAPSDTDVIYAISNDGRVQVTVDGGRNWNLRRTGVPGWPRTTMPFAIHPADPRRAWLAVGAFATAQVLATNDAGATWTAADGDLPDQPVHCIAVDASQGEPPVLFAGTEAGLFRSVDGGAHWHHYAYGLPNAPVVDLRVEPARARMLAGTQGRGVWQVQLVGRREGLPRPEPR